MRISKGVREISAPSAAPLQQDAQTLGLWSFDDLAAQEVKPPTPANVPETFTIPAAETGELTRANGWPKLDDFRKWDRSLGGPTSNRFSALTQITKETSRNSKSRGRITPATQGEHPMQPNHRRCVMFARRQAGTSSRSTPKTEKSGGASLRRRKASGSRTSPRAAACSYAGRRAARRAADFRRGQLEFTRSIRRPGKPSIHSARAGARESRPLRARSARCTSTCSCRGYLAMSSARCARRRAAVDVQNETGRRRIRPRDVEQYRAGRELLGGMALDESRGIAFVSTGSPKPNYLGMATPATIFSPTASSPSTR